MVEEQKVRVDQAMTQVVDDVDKSYLRHLQGKMFKCAANCCEDKNGSVTSVQRCIETCSAPLQTAQKYVQQEFDHFQNRLQRCIMTCNDSIRDKMSATPSDSEVQKYTREFEGCAKKCVDSHIDSIPNMMKKMKEFLGKKEFQTN